VGRDWLPVVQVILNVSLEPSSSACSIAGGWLLPGRKRVIPYSIQTLKRLKPELFRQDLITLFDLLEQKKLKPVIAQRFPLVEARHAQELLAKGGVTGKIVLVCDGSSVGARAAGFSADYDQKSSDKRPNTMAAVLPNTCLRSLTGT
jgi:hypothetical protein